MLIVLPPSETKAPGGTAAPLDLASLQWPELNAVREDILADLQFLAAHDLPQLMQVLKLSPAKLADAAANAELLSAPTMPALERYTGVLYDALDAASLTATARQRLAVGSALFGLVAATDQIPFYRLSGGSKLPRRGADTAIPTMKARWGKAITAALEAQDELIVDLRSGAYQQLGKLPAAVTVRVESVSPSGKRSVVSHFNKAYKGKLARVLALSEQVPTTAAEVAEIARASGLEIETGEPGRETLTLVVTK
ncbi:peroxide stress protein YaaA [Corynebacterium caspium]|uniref:peroxide stress protein YaaA n=1 Tax=Corynebacterium caspium TaxID=234828 RepID=UPI00036FB635|nr:peroxide stress protein YaaA [Corynebacterium caspium]WKD59082.1 hypothetical protein CCASP_03390 [Corynebacterium caspium DSM 44850]